MAQPILHLRLAPHERSICRSGTGKYASAKSPDPVLTYLPASDVIRALAHIQR